MIQRIRSRFTFSIHRLLVFGGIMLLAAGFLLLPSAHADVSAQPPPPPPLPSEFLSTDAIQFQGEGSPDNAFCLGCHENPYLQLTFSSGEVMSVAVDGEAYSASVHGQHGTEGYLCIRCHDNIREYPHPEVTATTPRELTIELSTACARCHTDKYDEMLDSVHVTAMSNGNEQAAVCSDCHTGHEVQRITDEETRETLASSNRVSAAMCQTCHAEIYDTYASSVHGAALLTGNTDVPACNDCHGAHDTQGPSSGDFRLFSPQTCATCHADEELMAKYDISTDVFDTYVADFHGTTTTLFQETGPDQSINTPVCADCHGVHNIMAVSDPESPVIKDNLVSTCQQCHPNATANFSGAWLSHYRPDFEHAPLVAAANTVYGILIPAVLGVMGLFVVSDIFRRRSNRRASKGARE
jgi:hypothetical protein